MKYVSCYVLLLMSLLPARAADAIDLTFDPATAHQLELTDLGNGAWQITATGTDPYLHTHPINRRFDAQAIRILAFDYICLEGTGLQVFFAPSITETGSIHSRLPAAEGWMGFSMDMAASTRWSSKVRFLRMDFGSQAGRTLQIRNLRLRPQTVSEQLAAQQEQQRLRRQRLEEEMLSRYLDRIHPCQITRVTAGDDKVRIEGKLAGDLGNVYLCQLPPHASLLGDGSMDVRPKMSMFPFLHSLAESKDRFSLEVDRFTGPGAGLDDRLFSRWVITRIDPNSQGMFEVLSHARWADEVPCANDLPEEKPRSIKGLGAIDINRPMEDLETLGIDCATVNIVLNRLFSPATDAEAIPHECGGRTWRFSRAAVDHLDRTLRKAAERNIVTAAIVLINREDRPRDPQDPATLLAHPDSEPEAIFAMPDVASAEGVAAYRAALDFLARRYSRPDKAHGRIHHWIMHNEVDMGFQWTSAGPRGPQSYMDLYHKSMRLAYLTARKYNPHAKVFISLTHYWNHTPHIERGYRPKHLLEILLDWGRAEGDFEWAIAHHPYPESLLEPKTWRDQSINYTFDTPLITFRNIEVLSAWVRRAEALYEDKPRAVWLSEQGLNSRDYSEPSLTEQAAGMAYAWQKIKALETIEAFCYHNWIDNAQEGGLLLGLRKLPEDGMEPKPIWHLYQALGTPEEEAACEFARELIDVDSWDRVRFTGPVR